MTPHDRNREVLYPKLITLTVIMTLKGPYLSQYQAIWAYIEQHPTMQGYFWVIYWGIVYFIS